MDQLDRVEGDLRFVRNVVTRADRDRSPAPIYFLWAVLGLCGFALMDLRPAWVPWYWAAAGPAGFLASAFLGWRHARRTGHVTASGGSRYLLHWGAVLAAFFLAVLMPIGGVLPWHALGQPILLILALGYFQAGVHLDRPFLWVGLLIGAGYLYILVVSAFAWTVLGVVFATALTIAGLREGRLHEAAA